LVIIQALKANYSLESFFKFFFLPFGLKLANQFPSFQLKLWVVNLVGLGGLGLVEGNIFINPKKTLRSFG